MLNMQVRALLGAAAAAAMAIGLGLAPAAAATATWTVTPGGNFYTKYEFATPELTDATTGTRFSCTTGFVIHGTLKSGTGLADPIGTIANAVGASGGHLLLCTRKGLVLKVTFGGLPWPVRAIRYDGASPGTTSGILTGVTGTITRHFSGPSCSAVIDGTAPGAGDGRVHFTYANNGFFTITGAGNLHFYHVSGCNGHIKNGDSMTYTDSLGIRANGGQGGGSGINVITSP
jgi:hypothetical protein